MSEQCRECAELRRQLAEGGTRESATRGQRDRAEEERADLRKQNTRLLRLLDDLLDVYGNRILDDAERKQIVQDAAQAVADGRETAEAKEKT